MQAQSSVWRAWVDTLKTIAADKGVLLLIAIAPVIYGFFYPWPYSEQAVTRVPVAVVDYDHSNLSRQITRFAQASPRLEVRMVIGDERQARQALWHGEIGRNCGNIECHHECIHLARVASLREQAIEFGWCQRVVQAKHRTLRMLLVPRFNGVNLFS